MGRAAVDAKGGFVSDHIPDVTKMVCPFCGADAKPTWGDSNTPWFTCGTMVNRRNINRHDQTEVCERAERERLLLEITTLRTANAALVERVKRLEEAGDAMAHAEGCMCDNGVVCHRCFYRANDWRKAKATP